VTGKSGLGAGGTRKRGLGAGVIGEERARCWCDREEWPCAGVTGKSGLVLV